MITSTRRPAKMDIADNDKRTRGAFADVEALATHLSGATTYQSLLATAGIPVDAEYYQSWYGNGLDDEPLPSLQVACILSGFSRGCAQPRRASTR